MSIYQNKSIDQILQEILGHAQAEQYDHSGAFGYTMPDGKHHIFIYRDASEDLPFDDGDMYVIEPNRVVAGGHVPMGDTTSAPYGDLAQLLVGCAWCMEQFEKDRPKEKAVFNADLSLPKEEIDYINQLLSMTGKEIYDKYGLKRDETITNTAKFDNGYELDVKVVICEEDEKPYIDLVLFDDAGCEVACDTGGEEIEDTVEFDTDDARFICTIQPERELNQPAIYLCPQPQHQYSAAFSLSDPPSDGAIKLADEKTYPVEVRFRTDMNGSSCFESEQCSDLAQLLSTLDWCGKCRYTVQNVWDFDLDKTQDEKLAALFNDACTKRMELITAEMDKMYQVPEDPVKVYAVSAGGVKNEVYSGTLDECIQFCEDHNWTFLDENEFEWDLEVEESRETKHSAPDREEPSPQQGTLAEKIQDAQQRAGSLSEPGGKELPEPTL